MLILNGGIPRSGTVWIYTILREVLSLQGVPYALEDANDPAKVDAAIRRYSPDAGALIVHYHDMTDGAVAAAQQPHTRAFYNYRDPRDVVVSLMGLHECALDDAIDLGKYCWNGFAKAVRMPGTMFIPYEFMLGAPEATVFEIGLRLGFLMKVDDVRAIVEKTGADKHRRIMETLADQDASGDVAQVDSGRRVIRYHKDDLVNDRHIQSGKQGRWRDELDAAQQRKVNEVFAKVIEQLGYPPE